jgi:uncharacterized protein YdhG (YjbR/CyaY superfamily)
MAMNKITPKSIDDYIDRYPQKVQDLLKQMRRTIQKAAPQAKEKISYRIPTYTLNGNLVHFGAFKGHVSFFPTSSGISAFEKELSGYKTSRGTVQFPIDKPLPLALVSRIVKFRVKESLSKLKKK